MDNQYRTVYENSSPNYIEEQKIISINKFIVLCLVTFGLYPIWWIYKAWRFLQEKEQSDILPVLRTVFSIFFLYKLSIKILSFAKDKGYEESYSPVILFIGFVTGNVLSRLPDPYWLISLLSFVFLIPAFKALNYAKQNSTDFVVTEKISYSRRQILLIVLGVILWPLIILGMIADGML